MRRNHSIYNNNIYVYVSTYSFQYTRGVIPLARKTTRPKRRKTLAGGKFHFTPPPPFELLLYLGELQKKGTPPRLPPSPFAVLYVQVSYVLLCGDM